jgi:hypothetical protein
VEPSVGVTNFSAGLSLFCRRGLLVLDRLWSCDGQVCAAGETVGGVELVVEEAAELSALAQPEAGLPGKRGKNHKSESIYAFFLPMTSAPKYQAGMSPKRTLFQAYCLGNRGPKSGELNPPDNWPDGFEYRLWAAPVLASRSAT